MVRGAEASLQNACILHSTRPNALTKAGKLAESGMFPQQPGSSHRDRIASDTPIAATMMTLAIDKAWGPAPKYRMFKRRLGPNPHARGAHSAGLRGCPDIFELESGDFAIIGRDVTAEATGQLPVSANCGPDERIVVIPRRTLVQARPDIPEKL
jgi:hypothetical protein